MSTTEPVFQVASGAASAPNVYSTSHFWDKLWRTSGIHAVLFGIVAYAIYGFLPAAGGSAEVLSAYYDTHRLRILIASVISGLAVLNLLWFAAALRSVLADAGKDGWGAAVTAASAAFGAAAIVPFMACTALTYSSGVATTLTSGLHDLLWTGLVFSSFPRAMLIMAGTFGVWRAGWISNRQFGLGVTAVLLTVLGGTVWMGNGFWAPDGVYSRFVSPAISFGWVLWASHILLNKGAATRSRW